MPLQNECLTGQSAEWALSQVVTGHSADWSGPQVAVKRVVWGLFEMFTLGNS